MTPSEAADEIERMWVLFPRGDDRRKRLTELAAAVRAFAAPAEDSHEHRLHRLLFELQGYISRPSLEAAIFAARLPAAIASTPRAAEALRLLNLLMTPAEPSL